MYTFNVQVTFPYFKNQQKGQLTKWLLKKDPLYNFLSRIFQKRGRKGSKEGLFQLLCWPNKVVMMTFATFYFSIQFQGFFGPLFLIKEFSYYPKSSQKNQYFPHIVDVTQIYFDFMLWTNVQNIILTHYDGDRESIYLILSKR